MLLRVFQNELMEHRLIVRDGFRREAVHLALGWEDAQAPVNRTRTEREPLARYFSVLR